MNALLIGRFIWNRTSLAILNRHLCVLVEQENESRLPIMRLVPKVRRKKNILFAWGLAAGGALAVPRFIDPKDGKLRLKVVRKPCRVPFADRLNINHVAVGFGFSLFSSSSQLFGAGLNICGQLGFHPSKNRPTKSMPWLIYPRSIDLIDEKIVDLACGRTHSLIATESGLFSFGNNSLGQCGRPILENENYGNNDSLHKVQLPSDAPIVQAVCGFDTSFVLLNNGEVYSFGLGADGQLGNGHYLTDDRPQLVSGDLSNEKVVRLAVTADTILAINDKGDLFGWGQSEYGQFKMLTDQVQVNSPRHLATPSECRIIDIAAGGSTCAILDHTGQVHVWGYGLLGFGPSTTVITRPRPLPHPLFDSVPVRSIVAGPMHLAAVTQTNQLYTWGNNRFGLLGLGHEKDQLFPFKVCMPVDVASIALGPDHTMAICRCI